MRTLALTLLLCACGTSYIDAKSYDQRCVTPTDCVGIREGDLCNVCGCLNAAINSKDRARYDGDAMNARRACGPQPAIACAACLAPMISCNAGRCELTTL